MNVPINCITFSTLNEDIQNAEATLLLFFIHVHWKGSHLLYAHQKWLVRSCSHMAKWLRISTRHLHSLLTLLQEKGYLTKIIKKWYGKRFLFLSINESALQGMSLYISVKAIQSLHTMLGSISRLLVFCRIAFSCFNTSICHEGKKWSVLVREQLAEFTNSSIRTIDRILSFLTRSGFVLRKKFGWKGRPFSHFRLGKLFTEAVDNPVDNLNLPPFLSHGPRAICSVSIKNKEKDSIINRNKRRLKRDKFDEISGRLSHVQEKYLKVALKKTIIKNKIKKEEGVLLNQLKFSITHPAQRKGITSFKHAVCRFMRLIRLGKWNTPYGYKETLREPPRRLMNAILKIQKAKAIPKRSLVKSCNAFEIKRKALLTSLQPRLPAPTEKLIIPSLTPSIKPVVKVEPEKPLSFTISCAAKKLLLENKKKKLLLALEERIAR